MKLGKQVLIISIIVSVLCSAACAQKLRIEKKGTYIYWFTYVDSLGEKHTTAPVKFKGQKADLEVEELGTMFKNARLFVVNKKTGNMAIVDYAPPAATQKPKPAAPKPVKPEAAKPTTTKEDAGQAQPSRTIEIDSDEFAYVPTIRLRIVAEDGAPIESGLVEITDGDGTDMSSVVTPADKGVAAFENVAIGEIGVKVVAEGVKKTVDSDIELPSKRASVGFEKDIRVKGDVDTLETTETGEATEAAKAGGASGALLTLSGMVFLIVVAAIVWTVLKAKGMTTEKALRKMGVQLPGDQTAGAAEPAQPVQPVDPSMCPFCGQRRDADGNCACSIGHGGMPHTAVSTSGAGVPRLVGIQGTYMGQVFDIVSGSKLIGREATCDISLPNDTTVSRRHAVVTADAGVYSIRDEGSSNGTFVNGARITEQKLLPGDEVQVGGTRFRFEV